jgi:hypothetical protein
LKRESTQDIAKRRIEEAKMPGGSDRRGSDRKQSHELGSFVCHREKPGVSSGRLYPARDERMHERRQFVSDLLSATISTCALLVVPTQSLSLEDPLKSQLDKQFSAAVRRVAAVRATNRATAIVVTHLFKDLTDTYLLSDFQSYVAERYKLTRVRDVVGNVEYANLNDTTLKQFDRQFFDYDRLDINFRYSADWKDIVEFSAILRNLRL